VTIAHNNIRDVGRACTDVSNGQSVPGASGTLITNNVFYNHRYGWAIQVYPGTVDGLSILNNTFALSNPYSAGQMIIAASSGSSF
jgi:hypothetical protein